MATSYTTNVGLAKPATSDTGWQLLLNANLDRIDKALHKKIRGLELSTAGSSATFSVAAGNASAIDLAASISKTTSAWAVGTGNGSLDTGAIANNTMYHVWLIRRSDTGVVDILTSLSATAPTMPASYDYKHRIGAMKVDGSGKWTKFFQLGDLFLWDTKVNDVAGVTSGVTTALLTTLTVPTGIQVEPLFTSIVSYNGSSSNYVITSPSQADNAASSTNRDGVVTSTIPQSHLAPPGLLTDTSGRIRFRFSAVDAVYEVHTRGWRDPRGQW